MRWRRYQGVVARNEQTDNDYASNVEHRDTDVRPPVAYGRRAGGEPLLQQLQSGDRSSGERKAVIKKQTNCDYFSADAMRKWLP